MITVPLLTADDLKVFQGKKVLISGFSETSKLVFDVFTHFDFDVLGFYSDSIIHKVRKYKGASVVSTKDLQAMSGVRESIVFQNTNFDIEKIEFLENKVEKLGLTTAKIPVGQLIMSFYPQILLDNFDETKYRASWEKMCCKTKNLSTTLFKRENAFNKLIICMPTKTADFTLMHTFEQANAMSISPVRKQSNVYRTLQSIGVKLFKNENNQMYKLFNVPIKPLDRVGKNIEWHNVGHKPRYANELLQKKSSNPIKIISAVREPISQNISIMYQQFSSGDFYVDWILGELKQKNETEKKQALSALAELFVDKGCDVQAHFDAFVDRYIYSAQNTDKQTATARSIQQFYHEFEQNILDITAYPFDQEKGYTIIKKDNVEIFIYQLEKLNHLVPELSAWLGVPFDSLVRGNDAADKWIGDSYKQAQKEIQITQEYFDKCFNEPYVQHCYSQADIEKFKAKWQSHIKHEN